MAMSIVELLPSLYRALTDTDRSDPTYSDEELKGLLKDAIAIVEGMWPQGYTIDADYNISPTPPMAMQMVFVLKAALMQRTYEVRYSYSTEIIKITRTSKKEDIDYLNQQFKELVQEMQWVAGNSTTEWDDYMGRIDQIMDAVSGDGMPHTV